MKNDINAQNNESVVENKVVVPETGTEKISVEDKKFKSKLLGTTDRMGVTQGGSVVKGFLWGIGIGISLTLGFQWAKRQGFINLK